MSTVKEISFDDFRKEVLEEERPVLVKHWAPWCIPCKALAPKIAALAMKYPDVKFVAVDVSKFPDTDVQALPTLRIYSYGTALQTFAGTIDTKRVEQALLEALRG